MQTFRDFVDSGGQEILESLPDGIHSGLVRERAKGVFFYFQGYPSQGEKLHFWRYYDLAEERIVDNDYIIANMIACDRDTARCVDSQIFRTVFDLQGKVLDRILASFEEQRALEVTPRTLDPIQQTVAIAIQGYMNHPDIERSRAIEAIRFLNQPLLTVQIRELRRAFKSFQDSADVKQLLEVIEGLRKSFGTEPTEERRLSGRITLDRSDLRLICFDVISGG